MKLTRAAFNVCAGCPCPAACQIDRSCAEDSVHLAKPLAESAVASHECGSVPDAAVWISETLIRDEWVNHVNTDPSIHHWPEVLAFAKRIAVISANKGYRTGLKAGMQPPNNQPNLICKSCGADRSKEDCKGDRLRCGLASIAHSDHVAVTSAKTDSVHLAEPTETSTDTRLEAVVRASFMKSKLFKMFTEQSFWHANYVNLQWRYNGKYVHEEADWIKDIWYAMRGHNPGERKGQSGVSLPNTAGQPNEQNDVVQEGKQ